MNAGKAIVDKEQSLQLVWYSSVQRMGEQQIPNQVLNWVSAGREKSKTKGHMDQPKCTMGHMKMHPED